MGVRPGEFVGHEPCSITLWWLVRVRPAPPRSRAFWRLLRSGGQPIIIENVGGAGRCRGIRALTGHTTSEQDDWRARQTDEVCRSLGKGKRAHLAYKRDRSSAFLAANSSAERIPFCCKSAS